MSGVNSRIVLNSLILILKNFSILELKQVKSVGRIETCPLTKVPETIKEVLKNNQESVKIPEKWNITQFSHRVQYVPLSVRHKGDKKVDKYMPR